MGDLTRNFSRSEFACPCCGRADVDMRLVEALQELRDLAGVPVRVNSGFRCAKHNREVGGAAGPAGRVSTESTWRWRRRCRVKEETTMQQLERIVIFVLENKELFATLLVTLLTIVKLTSWGRAKEGAMAAREAGLPAAARDAIRHAVSKADPKKTPDGLATRVVREVLRGVLPRK